MDRKMMTRNELRIIAEEIYKLAKKDLPSLIEGIVTRESDEYFNLPEAAKFLGVSESFIKDHIKEIPHTKVGRLNKFKKSSLESYRSRN